MMEFLKNLFWIVLIKVVIYNLAVFYGVLATIAVLVRRFIKGADYWVVKERTLPPLCLQDPDYGRHSYIRLKDVKIHYVENGDRSKPLMLFVHGFPEFWFSWRQQLKYFASTHWVVAIDMRGYGDSDKPSGVSPYKVDILQKDINDIVKALGRDKCILVGHDWGGAICWGVATHYPDLVEKLIILNAPHAGAFEKKIKGSFQQFLKSWYIFFFQLPYLPEIFLRTDDLEIFRKMFESKISEEDLEGYKYTYARKGAWTPPLNYYRGVLEVKKMVLEQETQYPKIKAPTLVIWGENDPALDKELPELSREFVENIQIQYIPAHHFVQQDKPHEVNTLIKNFVS